MTVLHSDLETGQRKRKNVSHIAKANTLVSVFRQQKRKIWERNIVYVQEMSSWLGKYQVQGPSVSFASSVVVCCYYSIFHVHFLCVHQYARMHLFQVHGLDHACHPRS